MGRPTTAVVVWVRRASQAGFFLLFVHLFLQTVYKPVNETGAGITLFFRLDPLSALTTGLGTGRLASGLLLGVVTVGVTLLAGRWFCGWVCPFGALHHLVSAQRTPRLKTRIQAGGYSGWQKSKYYVLAALLGGCLLGLNLGGLLDPFSFLYRSLAIVVFPAVNDAVTSLFTGIYQAAPRLGSLEATAVTEPVYEALRRHVLAVSQPHYHGTLLVAVLFVTVLVLNLHRARFWCRYVCPLGALLGIVGKNPLVRLERTAAACNDCRLCLAHCQGGADPAGSKGWKPSECHYCWNCRSACPHQALTFAIAPPAREKRP